MPDLKQDFEYWKRDHGQNHGRSEVPLQSQYIYLEFTIDQENGWIWLSYEQESFEKETMMLVP